MKKKYTERKDGRKSTERRRVWKKKRKKGERGKSTLEMNLI